MKERDYESLSKGISRDMSSQAIAERLRIVSELYDLAKTLSTARCLGSVESLESAGTNDAPQESR